MNNQIIMENYLLVLKSTTEVFVHGTLESSNSKVRNVLKEGLNTILSRQAATYTLMSEYGWYPINNIKKDEISKTISKLMSQN